MIAERVFIIRSIAESKVNLSKLSSREKKIIAQFIATIRLEFQASPNVKPSNDNKARSVKLPRIQVVCFVTRTMSSLKQETPRARMIESVTGKFVFKCGKASFVDKLIKQIVILFITNQSQFAFPINSSIFSDYSSYFKTVRLQTTKSETLCWSRVATLPRFIEAFAC